MKQFRISVLAIAAMLSFASCSSDDDAPVPVNEEEVITTVTATFTPMAGGSTITLTSRDLDGDGPNAPVVTASGNFVAGITYHGSIVFLNELNNPAENITDEIEEEGDEHQIFYQQNGLGSFIYDDEDMNGNPVGLHFTYTAATTPITGNLTVTLRHEPNKAGEGVAAGSIANAGGSTDAEVTFAVTVAQ